MGLAFLLNMSSQSSYPIQAILFHPGFFLAVSGHIRNSQFRGFNLWEWNYKESLMFLLFLLKVASGHGRIRDLAWDELLSIGNGTGM